MSSVPRYASTSRPVSSQCWKSMSLTTWPRVQLARHYHTIRDDLVSSTKTQRDPKPLKAKRKVARAERKVARIRQRLRVIESGEFKYVHTITSSIERAINGATGNMTCAWSLAAPTLTPTERKI